MGVLTVGVLFVTILVVVSHGNLFLVALSFTNWLAFVLVNSQKKLIQKYRSKFSESNSLSYGIRK